MERLLEPRPTDSNADFSQSSLGFSVYTLTYTKTNYLTASQSDTLATDNQTLTVETITQLPDNCTNGTMSGTITNAVTGDNMAGVSLSYTIGFNKFSGFTDFGDTDTIGAWSLSMSEGWYTIKSVKSLYYNGYHNAKVCDNQTEQNNSLSPTLNEGEMRIVLKWPKTNPVTATDLDSHLSIPNKDDNGTVHLSRDTNVVVGGSICHKCDYYIYGANDNVTLDKDHKASSPPAPPPGDETMTITKVRSGTYSYSVHNYTDRAANTDAKKTNFSKSNAKVKVLYNNEGTLVTKRFHVPNKSGTLWRVFTFDSSRSGSGFTVVDNMSYLEDAADIY